MTIMRLRNVGKTGVTTDIPPYDLTPSDWSWANNVRFEANRVQKIGGAKAALLRDMPREIPLGVVQQPITESLVYGTWNPANNKGSIYRAEGVSHKNISKLGTDGNHVTYSVTPEETWEYTTLSNTVIFNTHKENPQGIAPGEDNFHDLPGWGKPNKDSDVTVDWKANRIRAYKTYLLCLGITEGPTEHPQRVRWSDTAYIGTLPPNWWENSESNDGGFNDLTDSQSHIIDGRPLRDSFVIYTNRDTFIMDYVGGTMVFNFRKIFSDSGILAANCCVEFEGQHFVISEEDIFVHNGSTRQSVATGRVKDYLMKQISSTNYNATRVYSYPTRKEIWITYVSTNAPAAVAGSAPEDKYACDKAAIWSWEYNTWTFADLPNIYDIALGISPETDARTWANYDPSGTNDYAWNSEDIKEDVWNQYAQTFTRHQMFGASMDRCFYMLDTGYKQDYYDYTKWGQGPNWNPLDPAKTTVTTRPVYCEVRRDALDFDEQEPDISYHKWWRSIYPQMGGKGTVRFFIGGSNSPNGSPVWDSWQDFDIETDYKVDCFSNYRYPAIRILDTAEGEWNMIGYDVDYFREGNR
ncbi:hypothetical protein GAP52_020 [Cronobacter phage vB_CsaP_GAP52]|uniref:Virion structural protein n=1 Tax=Cronobacter phage vB_CsaP_GAP52 TaxID=1141137 RepID=K4F7E2_9CAUD|nr:virion structural protein [Cronobacter phage vB_CsaP_GAP52]AFC22013.1 hypothetical protein GAP52_020 [Cronobacter phage vB_CsaP_GAP52]